MLAAEVLWEVGSSHGHNLVSGKVFMDQDNADVPALELQFNEITRIESGCWATRR